MEIRVVNFETLTKSFLPYVKGWLLIEEEKQKMSEEMAPVMKELQEIYARSQSGLIVDEFTQQRDVQRFQSLQNQMIETENQFKADLKKKYEDLSKNTMDQLTEVVGNWAKDQNIDLIISKEEVLYNSTSVEITNDILELFNQQGLLDNENLIYKNK